MTGRAPLEAAGFGEPLPFDLAQLEQGDADRDWSALGVSLREAGLHPAGVERCLGLVYCNRFELEAVEGFVPDEHRSSVVTFFVAGAPVPPDRLQRAGVSVDRMLGWGLVREAEGQLEPLVCCLPFGRTLILCDWARRGFARDYVAAPDLSAYHLIAHARRRQGSWLDLATGTGVVGLVAAHGSVVGADLNARSIAFAQASALLNGRRQARWFHADLFDGLPSERWDTITFNPPLVELDRDDPDGDAPLYLAGASGLRARFWREVRHWVAPGGEVIAHTSLPEDPEYPRSLGLPGAFVVTPFTLGSASDTYCVTAWRPDDVDSVRILPPSDGERPPRIWD